jgi:hypothetical protein
MPPGQASLSRVRPARLPILLLASCFLSAPAAYGEGAYELGHGYDIGPFNLAGYSNLVGNAPDQGGNSLALDDLSLFVTGHLGRLFNPFTEAELTHFDFARSGPSDRDKGDGDVVIERLYNDSTLSDSLTLRLGKMLTPVGEWNEIHAAPLVPTTVRPAVTFRNFSEHTTGFSFLYSDPLSRLPDLEIYWQPTSEFSERPRTITFHQYRAVEGAHLSFPIGLLDKVGLSFQQSKDINGTSQSLYGLDFHYTIGKLTLAGEGTFSDISNSIARNVRDAEWGAYAVASYTVTEKWSIQGWYEGFADRQRSSPAHDLLIGVTYKPDPAIVLRLEYLENIGGQPVNPTGLSASWAVLF